MAPQFLAPIPIGHPAPQRDRVSLVALTFGLVAAPLAWSLQLLLGVALSGHACFPRNQLLAQPLWHGLGSILWVISVTGIVFACVGCLTAFQSWRRTYNERPDSVHHLLDRGEGRTRFMAMAGMLVSALFLVAMSFGAVALYLVPLCDR